MSDSDLATLIELSNRYYISTRFLLKRYVGWTDDKIDQLKLTDRIMDKKIIENIDGYTDAQLCIMAAGDVDINITDDEDTDDTSGLGSIGITGGLGNSSIGGPSFSGNITTGQGISSNGFTTPGFFPTTIGQGLTTNLITNEVTISTEYESTPKSDIEYIIVRADGSRLIYDIQNLITPREMIGLSQFFQVIAMASTGVSINWSSMITALKIERHFAESDEYDDLEEDDILYVYLNDPT